MLENLDLKSFKKIGILGFIATNCKGNLVGTKLKRTLGYLRYSLLTR